MNHFTEVMMCTEREHDKEGYRPAGRPASNCALSFGVCPWLFVTVLLQLSSLSAEPIPVRYSEGTTHGFLALRTMEGKLLATGDLTEVIHGFRVVARAIFSFKDGSVDDETTVYSQHGTFRLISDHHIQKGPSFPHPTNVSINASTGQVTVHYKNKDQERVDTEHMDLPPDLANGLLLTILKNISPDTKETKVSYVGGAPKPRLVHLSITPASPVTFTVAGARHKAIRYTVKVEIGGVAGLVAPLVGKKPADAQIWVVNEGAPAFVRADEALYMEGPIWSIQMTGPEWGKTAYSGHK
ncbi:MAG: hypothetical protein M3Y24_01855 [Acidobacteriota bacterium]|nr:hypothetical protein [Acidobacteriota bacterium]